MRRTNKHPVTTPPPIAPEAVAPLSPQRAFLVQFRLGAGHDPAHFDGQVEHLVSGDTARFHTPADLLGFIARVLGGAAREHPGQP
jgi:hypothetical protein